MALLRLAGRTLPAAGSTVRLADDFIDSTIYLIHQGKKMSMRARVISFVMRHTIKKQMSSFEDHLALRKQAGSATGRTPAEVHTQSVSANGVPAEWVRWREGVEDGAILYLHGGGYVFGSLDSHRNIAWRLARASGLSVLLVDYRLAPEHPYPAAVDDAFGAYQWLLDQQVANDRLVVAGDSAGGGLATALMLRLKTEGLRLPEAAVLLSPWADLTLSGASMSDNAAVDAMLSPEALSKFKTLYLGNTDPGAAYASPLYADLSGLPPVHVTVGSTEVLLSDAENLVTRINTCGGTAELSIWPKLPHVFPIFGDLIPESKQAIEEIAAFIRTHVKPGL